VESTTRGLRRVETPNEERPVIERASAADLAFLAMDTGKVPEQFAVILILERPGDRGLLDLRQLIGGRILSFTAVAAAIDQGTSGLRTFRVGG
jgi:hypothetical protein